MTYYEWFAKWKSERKQERLGQAFCNDFIKMPWPELYHCTDDERSARIIYYYLTDHQFWPNMPKPAEVVGKGYDFSDLKLEGI